MKICNQKFHNLHLEAALRWLSAAQDACKEDRGVSSSYHLLKGWQPSYPETTGYIINTFLDYSRFSGVEGYVHRALDAGDWLLKIQFPNGAFPGGFADLKASPRVFNTGMILFGLADLAGLTGDERYFRAGMHALEWLIETQDSDGTWTTISPERKPHAYHSRVAWGMLKMLAITKESQNTDIKIWSKQKDDFILEKIKLACDWVISRQDSSGWFHDNDLIDGFPPLTHNIAYVIRGLLETGILLQNNDYINAAIKAGHSLWLCWKKAKYFASSYGENWQPGPAFRCVTGEAQIGIIWLRMAQISGHHNYRLSAENLAHQVAQCQWMISPHIKELYGAIPGAVPIWGRYLSFAYPNWAAKFFADLLLELDK